MPSPRQWASTYLWVLEGLPVRRAAVLRAARPAPAPRCPAARRPRRPGPGLAVHRHAQQLQCDLDERLRRVGEHQVVVGHAVADRVEGTHRVEERGEERQRVPVLRRREVTDPRVRPAVRVRWRRQRQRQPDRWRHRTAWFVKARSIPAT